MAVQVQNPSSKTKKGFEVIWTISRVSGTDELHLMNCCGSHSKNRIFNLCSNIYSNAQYMLFTIWNFLFAEMKTLWGFTTTVKLKNRLKINLKGNIFILKLLSCNSLVAFLGLFGACLFVWFLIRIDTTSHESLGNYWIIQYIFKLFTFSYTYYDWLQLKPRMHNSLRAH